MRFLDLELPGVVRICPDPHVDHRGQFARTFCRNEFSARNLPTDFLQASTALTHKRGTIRGLHFQNAPHWETKLVRCTRGAALVVVVDLRPETNTYSQWLGIELNEHNREAVLVPEGCAQGYQTLADNTELLYQMTKCYEPSAATGVRYDDPAFAIQWPLPPQNLSERDLSWDNFLS